VTEDEPINPGRCDECGGQFTYRIYLDQEDGNRRLNLCPACFEKIACTCDCPVHGRYACAGVSELQAEVEQLRVQLAGCGVAADGGISPPVLATEGMYGWSPAYQAVVDLRRRFETQGAPLPSAESDIAEPAERAGGQE